MSDPSANQWQDSCKICGDSAGCGVNFGCLSCESCKAFFRRCSVRLLSPKCPFVGNCRITKASRRACQACRLAKCLRVKKRQFWEFLGKNAGKDNNEMIWQSISHHYESNYLLNGMRMELVDVWKKLRRKTAIEKGGNGTGKSDGTFDGKAFGIDGEQNDRQEDNEHSGRAGEGTSAGRRKCCGCKCETAKQMAEKGTQTEDGLAQNGANEHTLLTELIRANGVLDAPLRVPSEHALPHNLTLVDALRISEWAMRRMVAMCKQLNTFRALPQSDQVTLLRASLVQLLILRGAMAFDPANEVWRHALLVGGSDGPMPFLLNLNVLPATERHYEEHKRFLMTFGEQWRNDRTVMLLLQAIVLFSHRTDQMEAGEVIGMHRRIYRELLRRHLDGLTQSGKGTENAFAHLMAKLDELVKLNNSFHQIYLQLNQNELEPLFREIYAAK